MIQKRLLHKRHFRRALSTLKAAFGPLLVDKSGWKARRNLPGPAGRRAPDDALQCSTGQALPIRLRAR